MLTVAVYLWHDGLAKTHYGVEDVYLARRMVARHLTVAHDFVCVTDQPHLFADSDVRAVRLVERLHLPGRIFSNLMTFAPEARGLIGERILMMDLDFVAVGDMNPLVTRDEDLVLWRNPGRRPWANPEGKGRGRALYNTSLVLHRAGTFPQLWQRFEASHAQRFDGIQEYVSALVGPDMPYWDDADGVYRLGRPDTPGSGPRAVLPDNARIVFFPGDEGKPTRPDIAAECPWIAEHRR